MILSYKALQLPSDKALVRSHFYKKLDQFTHYNNQETKLEVFEPAYFLAVKRQATHFQKTRIAIGSGDSTLDIISRNTKFHSFVWHTTTDKIRLATRYGIVKTQSLTSKVIAALGNYRLIVLDRMRDGYKSNRYVEKEFLINHFQERFEKLQVLENLVNQTPSIDEVVRALEQYEKSLNSIDVPIPDLAGYLLIDAHHGIHSELKAIANLRRQIKVNKMNLTGATGTDSLFTFVKTQMIRSLKLMQSMNQKISYSPRWRFAATRGDLQSCIVDAERVIHDHLADPHNPLRDSHHGIFHKPVYQGVESEKTRVAYRSTEQGLTADEEQRALLAISVIEGQDGIDRIQLKTRAATKWAASVPMVYLFKRSLAFCVRLFFGLFDLVLAPITRPLYWLGVKTPGNILTRLATYEVEAPPHYLSRAFLNIQKLTYRRIRSLRARVSDGLAIIANQIRDLYKSLKDVSNKIAVELPIHIQNDKADGVETVDEFRALYSLAREEIEQIELYAQQTTLALTKDIRVQTDDNAVEMHAVPDFKLSAGERNDILNALARGNDVFFGFFWHHLYAKHPFTSLVFSGTYALGGLSVLIPQSMSFLGSFVGMSQTLGTAMAQSELSAAFAAGFTLAKGTAGLVELGLHGPKSWAVSGLKEAEKDPVAAVIYTGAAISLGYVISYELAIPFLSEYLKEDIGTIWPVAAALVGAKLGVLIFELFYLEDQAEIAAAAEINEKIALLIQKSYEEKFPDQSQEEVRRGVNRALVKINDRKSRQRLRDHYESFELIKFIRKNGENLPFLSESLKHKMMKKLRQYFSPVEMRSLKTCFYPESPKSILRTTLNIVAEYPVYLVRYVAAIFNSVRLRNMKPLASVQRDFSLKLKTDLARVVQALTLIIKSIVSAVRIVLKSLADVIGNSLMARPIGLLSDNHRLTDLNYSISMHTDVAYERSRQFVSYYPDKMTKAVTYPHKLTLFDRANKSTQAFIQQTLPKLLEAQNEVSSLPSVTTKKSAPSESFDSSASAKYAMAVGYEPDYLSEKRSHSWSYLSG